MMMMIYAPKHSLKVCVVDTQPGDYSDMNTEADAAGIDLQVFTSGRDALRRDATQTPEMWVVNMRLPDMPGTDLMNMLRWRYPGVPVVLVSDSYRAEDEITARCSGAEMYLSKPLRSEWLASTTGSHR